MKQRMTFGFAAAAACWLAIGQAEAQVNASDTNPALLYWQAFAVMPELSADEQKHLLEKQWLTERMDGRAGELAARYDATFKLLGAAAESRAPCDWGIDLSLGPDALLPHLAKAKRCATVAVVRSRWALQEGHPEDMKKDLVSTMVLARNLSRDKTIIAALVQAAIERMVLHGIVQQWPDVTLELAGALLEGFEGAPARGTMAEAVRTERVALYGWLVGKINQIRAKHPTNEQAALEEIATLIEGMRGPAEPGQDRKQLAGPAIQAAGGTITGLLNYLAELEPMYHELERVMNLPYAEFEPAMEQLEKLVKTSPNAFAHELLPPVLKVREKEFKTIAWFAMVQAAYQHRLDPAQGLQKVSDPFGNGPFEYRRFVLDGVDRGFILESKLRNPEFPEVLIFAEKKGPPFYVDGPRAGQPIR